MWVGGQSHAAAVLTPGMTLYPWVPEPVWAGDENLALNGIRNPDRPGRRESL